MALNVVILAAGKGTRMRSKLPKVLHPVADKPMVQHVIDTAAALDAGRISVVYGHGGEQVCAVLADQAPSGTPLGLIEQAEQLGTGHAVAQALPSIDDTDTVLVLYGDVPLIRPETLTELLDARADNGVALLTVVLDNPTGYGRILREGGHVTGIVEQKDASAEQLAINEVNTGILAASGADLRRYLGQLSNDNAQGEYYLTDVIAMAHGEGRPIVAVQARERMEVEGANNRVQLATLEQAYQARRREALMLAGATLRDPQRVDVRGEVSVGEDVLIDVGVIFEGRVVLGNDVEIGAGCILSDCTVADGTVIKPYSVIEQAQIGADCTVGPFARIRPDTVMAPRSHVGNFVELKKVHLGEGSKANHLSYLGDSEIGCDVNIGAGTITCNYDGANKHKTVIEDQVFVGSDTQLVAPVTVKRGATIAAGSTVTKGVGEQELVLTRVRQRHVANWQRPVKKS